jgi:predicted amidophosphoribosyltransferase
MTSALNPSPWYTALATYKGFQPQHGAILASVAYRFLETNQASIGTLLGGPATILTIVPSKRGITYDQQPLRAALSCVQSLKDQLRQTLAYDSTKSIGRKEYIPAAFTVGPESPEGMRVVLIEDTWVTGATAMSAAGALLRYGAESVAVFPIARVLNDHYWADDHPYRRAMVELYDDTNPLKWPR